jgi:hypothetical protein
VNCLPVGAPPPAAGTPPPASGDKPWYDGAGAEDVGYFQNRGWDKVDAKTAAINAAKAHREAEKLIGAPAAELVRLPKDPNDAAGWAAVRSRLGVPADEKGYNFADVKHADGSALTEAEAAAWAKRSHSAGLRPADAVAMVADAIKAGDEPARAALSRSRASSRWRKRSWRKAGAPTSRRTCSSRSARPPLSASRRKQ